MSSGFLLNPLSSIFFEDKLQFSARQALPYARHKCFTFPQTDTQDGVWSIKAPDFSVRLYRTLSEPQKKDRRGLPPPAEAKKIILPKVLPESNRRKDSPKFITFYRAPDGMQSELTFVKTGKYPSGPYKNPTPHNFRPLDEHLPDVDTTYEKDPGNLIIKLKNLDFKTHHVDQTLASKTTRQRWTPINLQSQPGIQDSIFLIVLGLQNLLPTQDTSAEEEPTVHSWSVWRRNSPGHGKNDD